MKNGKVTVLSMAMVGVLAFVMTFAATFAVGAVQVNAAADYGYKITVSGGNGTIEGDGVSNNIAELSSKNIGDLTASVSGNTITLGTGTVNVTKMPDGKAPDESIYFVRGVKVAGTDNDKYFTSLQLNAAGGVEGTYMQDVELVVAYGVKSGMVAYTVSYTGPDGSDLGAAETFYGVIGDTPIVTFKYFDGYVPNAFAETRTLVSDASQNVFEFTYRELQPGEVNVVTIVDGAAAGAAGAGA